MATPSPGTTAGADSTLARILEKQQETTDKLVEAQIERQSLKSNIAAGARDSAILMVARDEETPAERLNKNLQLIVAGSKTSAQSMLQQFIRTERGGTQVVDAAKTSIFMTLAFRNPVDTNNPGGLSVFFCCPAPILQGDGGQAQPMSHEEAELRKEAKALTEAQIQALLKSKINVPSTFDELSCTLENFGHEVELATDKASGLFFAVQKVCTGVKANAQKFRALIANDKQFIPRFLQKIDILVQNFIDSCAKNKSVGKLNWMALDKLQKMVKKIATTGDTVNVSIPPAVLALMSPNNPKKRKKGGSETGDKSTPVINESPNSAWKLKENESFGRVFGGRMQSIPKYRGENICGRYHIMGKCRLGDSCRRAVSHCPLTGDAKQAMDDWVKKCRNAAQE